MNVFLKKKNKKAVNSYMQISCIMKKHCSAKLFKLKFSDIHKVQWPFDTHLWDKIIFINIWQLVWKQYLIINAYYIAAEKKFIKINVKLNADCLHSGMQAVSIWFNSYESLQVFCKLVFIKWKFLKSQSVKKLSMTELIFR